jgi:hypothetical protein
MPENEEKNLTTHALAQIAALQADLNVTNLRTVYGDYDGLFGPNAFLEEHKKWGNVQQLGLTLAHLQVYETIWQQDISAAWIFEDDVVFHEDFKTAFPLYWSHVPDDYEVVWVGYKPEYHGEIEECSLRVSKAETFVPVTPYSGIELTTHAMIVSLQGAKRLAKAMRGLLDMNVKANRNPFVLELGWIDRFLQYVGTTFLPEEDRHRWVVFRPATQYAAQWDGYFWCEDNDWEGALRKADLEGFPCCEMCSKDQWALVQSFLDSPVPLRGTGLAYQNLCKIDPWRLETFRWAKSTQSYELDSEINGETA